MTTALNINSKLFCYIHDSNLEYNKRGQFYYQDQLKKIHNKLLSDGDSLILIDNNMQTSEQIQNTNYIIEKLKQKGLEFDRVVTSTDSIEEILERNIVDHYVVDDESTNEVELLGNENIKVHRFDENNMDSIIDEIEQEIARDNTFYTPKNRTNLPSTDDRYLGKYKTGDFKRYKRLLKNKDITQVELFKNRNIDRLKEIGLEWQDTSFTYEEMFEKVEEITRALSTTVKEGEVVGICAPNVPTILFAFLAVQNLSAIPSFYHPLVPGGAKSFNNLIETEGVKTMLMLEYEKTWDKIKDCLNETSLEEIIAIPLANYGSQKLKIKASIGQSKGYSLIKTLKSENTNKKEEIIKIIKKPPFKQSMHCHNLVVKWEEFIKRGNKIELQKRNKIKEAVIVHTSGTKKQQKSVLITHEQLNANQAAFQAMITNVKPGDTILAIAPMFHILGLNNCVTQALRMGINIKMLSNYDANTFHQNFEKCDINFLFAVPTIVRDMLQNERMYENIDFSNLKYCYIGGEDIHEKEMKRIETFFKSKSNNPDNCIVGQSLGATENTCCYTLTDFDGNNIGTVGKPLFNTKVKVVNPETNKEVGYNEEGELYFSTPSIMECYYKNSEETNKVFAIDENGEKWLHHNDFGVVLDDGSVKFIGRDDDIVKVDGEKVDLGEIKKHFYNTGQIRAVELFKMRTKKDKVRVGALAILEDSQGININKENLSNKICETCYQNLGAKSVPIINYVEEFPKTLNLKIDRTAIVAKYGNSNN